MIFIDTPVVFLASSPSIVGWVRRREQSIAHTYQEEGQRRITNVTYKACLGISQPIGGWWYSLSMLRVNRFKYILGTTNWYSCGWTKTFKINSFNLNISSVR